MQQLDACVDGVMVENGFACGVFLADGKKISSSAVVANIAPRILYSKLLPPSDKFKPGAFKLKSDHLSRCQLFILLTDDTIELPFVTFYATTYDKVAEYQAFVRGEPLSMRIFYPPGLPKTMSIAAPASFDLWKSTKNNGSTAYETMKDVLTKRLIELLQNAYPGLLGKFQVVRMYCDP